LRALQSARASSAAFALSAELRLAPHCVPYKIHRFIDLTFISNKLKTR